MSIEYSVQIVWSREDGAYIALPAELPGCMADGQTQEEALTNLRQVIREWIEVAKEENRDIPAPMTLEDFEKAQKEAVEKLHRHIQKHMQKGVNEAVQRVLSETAAEEFSSFLPKALVGRVSLRQCIRSV
jgi:predicted RNase H-like HicB family nuclease